MLWTLFAAEEEKLLSEITENMPGLQIISYRRFSLPIHKYEVVYKKSGSVAPDMIEELVLDALAAGFSLPITDEFIASALGLDVIFIKNCIKKLSRMKVVSIDENGVLSLTGRGRVYAENNLLPGGESEHSIEFFYDKKFGGKYIKAEGSAGIYDKFEQVDEYITDKTKFISPSLICEMGQRQNIKIENPEKGELISGFVSSEITDSGLADFLEIWLYDFVNKKVYCKVWDCENGEFAGELTRFAETYTYMNEVTDPQKYVQVKSDNYDRETIYSEMARNIYSAARFEKTSVGESSPVRIIESDEEIVIPESRYMIILSPWLYSEVVSDELLEIAGKTEYTLFGFSSGITPDSRCVKKLLEVTDEYGIPKILPCFIEGIGEKEILCGDKLHLIGSVDYLENADDYFKRSESVYAVKDADCISDADIKLKELFLASLGNQSIEDKRFVIAVLNVCSFLLEKSEFEDYLHRTIALSESDSLYNIYLFMKKRNLISEEDFNEITSKIGTYNGETFVF